MSNTAQQSGPHTMKGAKTSRSVRLTENQQMVLIRASQRDDAELIEPNNGSVIRTSGNKDTFGSSGNDLRMIQGFLNKGLIEGDPNEPSTLRLTALAFAALNIDINEWPKRLQTEECNAAQTGGVTIKDEPQQQVPRQPLRPGTKGQKCWRCSSANQAQLSIRWKQLRDGRPIRYEVSYRERFARSSAST